MPASAQKITFASERLVRVVKSTVDGEADDVMRRIREMKEQKRLADQIQADKEKQEEARRQYAKNKNKEAPKGGASTYDGDKSRSTTTGARKQS